MTKMQQAGLLLVQIHHNMAAERFERSEEHTSELQSLMRISYAVFCLKKKNSRNRLADYFSILRIIPTIKNFRIIHYTTDQTSHLYSMIYSQSPCCHSHTRRLIYTSSLQSNLIQFSQTPTFNIN